MQGRPIAALIALLCFSLLPVAAAHADNRSVPPVPTDWVSTLHRDHALVGKIYATGPRAFVSAQDMGRTIALARFVLLGEVHDNPDHHLLQAWAIRTISKLRGARIAEGAPQIAFVALEMIRADQQSALDKFYGRDAEVPRPRPPRALGRLLDWDKSGWPEFSIYEPVVSQAMHERLVIVPASPPLNLDRKVSKDWSSALSQSDIARLALDREFASDLQDALIAEIRDSHCGLIPETAFERMSRVQRFRDAMMADAMLSAGPYKGAILIAGNSHIRRDRAVPYFLEARGSSPDSLVSVAHVEVRPDENDPENYVSKAPDGRPAVDFVVFTPATDRPDPCEKMKSAMGKGASARSPAPQTAPRAEDQPKPDPK